MEASSHSVTKRLLARLLRDQKRRAEKERRMPFAKKLRVVDRLMAEGEPKIEDTAQLQ